MLASPRRRRRLAGAAIAAAVVALVVAAAAAFPEPEPAQVVTPTDLGPVVTEEREVRLTAAMRAGINETLARFVPAALSRKQPGVAWELAGPGMRAGTTKRDWLRGDLPVHPYPWRQQRVDGWRLIYAHPDRVAVDLLVRPPKQSRRGPIVFGIDLVRDGRRWLVNSMFPAAIFSGADERAWVVGAADFRAESATSSSFYERERESARLSTAWIAVPAVIFAAVLLIPVALLVWNAVTDRRVRARYGSPPRELPPLPRMR